MRRQVLVAFIALGLIGAPVSAQDMGVIGYSPTAALLGLGKNKKGTVCKQRDIMGEKIGLIERGACGMKQAVRVTEIAGVKLTNSATINCETAIALRDWLVQDVKKILKDGTTTLSSIYVADSYSCRRINHRAGANLSQHSFGNAVDVAMFTMSNGEDIRVLDWRSSNGDKLKKIHQAACTHFGTVLGPEADRHHQDHFHMDTKKRRYGSYCR